MNATTAAISACPYCRTTLEAEDELVVCEACATPHHADCYAENGGCTVFGCARAPVDEPKISVTTSEVAGQYRPLAAALNPSAGPTPPPPRRPGSTTAVPPPPGRGTRSSQPIVFEDTTRYLTPPRTLTFAGYNEQIPAGQIPRYIKRRSRLNYILLGVFLGSFGAHNFYAGYMKRAAVQLLLTVFVLFAGGAFWGGFVSWIWAIIEVCIVKQDDDGVAFI
jgi:TM2 domain-containing membrane protein YozV